MGGDGWVVWLCSFLLLTLSINIFNTALPDPRFYEALRCYWGFYTHV